MNPNNNFPISNTEVHHGKLTAVLVISIVLAVIIIAGVYGGVYVYMGRQRAYTQTEAYKQTSEAQKVSVASPEDPAVKLAAVMKDIPQANGGDNINKLATLLSKQK
jgi:flagellar basal body-associated protein FliL